MIKILVAVAARGMLAAVNGTFLSTSVRGAAQVETIVKDGMRVYRTCLEAQSSVVIAASAAVFGAYQKLRSAAGVGYAGPLQDIIGAVTPPEGAPSKESWNNGLKEMREEATADERKFNEKVFGKLGKESREQLMERTRQQAARAEAVRDGTDLVMVEDGIEYRISAKDAEKAKLAAEALAKIDERKSDA